MTRHLSSALVLVGVTVAATALTGLTTRHSSDERPGHAMSLPAPSENRRHTPARELSALDAPLSVPAKGDPRIIAERWLAARTRVLGWSFTRHRRSLRLARRSRDARGITHLRWTRHVSGVPVVDGDIRVSVARDGRVLHLSSTLAPIDRVPRSRRDAGAVRRALAADGRIEGMRLVALSHPRPRLAYEVVLRRGSDGAPQRVVFAADGSRELSRTTLRRYVTARAFGRTPVDPEGEDRRTVAIDDWLQPGGLLALGKRVTAFPDLNANSRLDDEEIVRPDASGAFDFPRRGYDRGDRCPPVSRCAFDLRDRSTWAANARSSTANVFVQANEFLDFMASAPYWFTEERGAPNPARPIDIRVAVGAGKDRLPIQSSYSDPGSSGRRRAVVLFLGYRGGLSADDYDADAAENSEHLAHELVHLYLATMRPSPAGFPDGDLRQTGALHEALSDVIAVDWQIAEGQRTDDPRVPGEIVFGDRVNAYGIRRQALDCPVGGRLPRPGRGAPALCVGDATYARFARFTSDGFEPHLDGEIMGQTLWDLRTRLVLTHGEHAGANRWRTLIASMVEGLPFEATFLDARDALLRAADGLDDLQQTIWEVFAARGMGVTAVTDDADDAFPSASFDPPSSRTATVSGLVLDEAGAATRVQQPLAGARVQSLGGRDHLGQPTSTVTDAAGRFRIAVPITADSHAWIAVDPIGYEPKRRAVALSSTGSGETTFWARRDHADPRRGARASAADDGIPGHNCGPSRAIGTFAHSYTSRRALKPTLTIELPAPVDITSIEIDPTNRCMPSHSSDDRDGALDMLRIRALSEDGQTWGEIVPRTRLGRRPEPLHPIGDTGRRTRTIEVEMLDNIDATEPNGYSPWVALNQIRVFSASTPEPVAEAAAPPEARVGEPVELDVSASRCTAPDGGRAFDACRSVTLDLNGDGGCETRATAATRTVRPRGPGVQRLHVCVEDEFGRRDRDAIDIVVRGARVVDIPAPPAATD